MFHTVLRMCANLLMFWTVLCTVSMLPAQVTALKLETGWVTIPMTAVDAKIIATQPGLPSYRILSKINGSIYIGSNETLSRLSLTNDEVMKDETQLIAEEPDLVVSCAVQNPTNTEIVCWNFIRIAEVTSSGDLLVCGTNAFSRLCYKCLTDLSGICTQVHNGTMSIDIGPRDRDSNPAAAILSNGMLYNGDDRTSTFQKIAVGNLTSLNPITLALDTVTTGGRFIKDATFVGKPFEYTHSDGNIYIFVFYRETALEYASHGVKEYSRIARVCENDPGGTVNTKKFVTFIKARLNCSIPDELLPFYFDDIQDVIWDRSNNEAYAIFTTAPDGPQASALCRFRMEDIMKLFDEGESKDQAGGEADNEWLPPSTASPMRPGTCTSGHTTTYSPLMDKLVPNYNPLEPSDSTAGFQVSPPSNYNKSYTPTLYVDGVRFTSMAIDMDNTVYFFGTSDGTVLKVNQEASQTVSEPFRIVEINELGTTGPITGLELLETNSVKYLVITTETNVITWALNTECSARSQQECESVRSPYCEWTDGACNCTNSVSGCVNGPTSDLLQVAPMTTDTACYNDEVYWYCHLDSDDPFVTSGFSLTWNDSVSDDYRNLLVTKQFISPSLLELKVIVRNSTVPGMFTCTATLGDTTMVQSVELTTEQVCESKEVLMERCVEHSSLKDENAYLQTNGFNNSANTCSVHTGQNCDTCSP